MSKKILKLFNHKEETKDCRYTLWKKATWISHHFTQIERYNVHANFFLFCFVLFCFKRLMWNAAFIPDINECLTGDDDCHQFATCYNTVGSYECRCNNDYLGDGRICIPIGKSRKWITLKGSQLDAFSPWAIVYCYLEFKLSYLKNLKLFSIRVKEFSEPIVLWRTGDRF